MNKLLPLLAMLAAGLVTSTAIAAGGTTSTPAPAPKVTIIKPAKQKKPVAIVTAPAKTAPVVAKAPVVTKKVTTIAKKVAPVTPATPVVATITDAWATKFGDLGPAYISAVKLANAAKYDDAIKAFNALNKPDDPRVNNWIGFSLRKQGKVDAAMPYYDKALKAAPDFTPAHEYLGEAYLQMKDMTKAKEQLAQIEKLCGNKTCEEYKDLSAAMKTAKM